MTTPYTQIDFTIHLPITLYISTHELSLRQLSKPSLLAEEGLARLLTSHILASVPHFNWHTTTHPPEITHYYEPPEPNEPPAWDAIPQSILHTPCNHDQTYSIGLGAPLLWELTNRTCPQCTLQWVDTQQATIPDDCQRYAFDPETTLLGREPTQDQLELADITRTSWWIWANSLGMDHHDLRNFMTLKPARWWSESYRNRPEVIYEALKNSHSWR